LASNEVKTLGHRRKVSQLPMKTGDELIFANRDESILLEGYKSLWWLPMDLIQVV